MALIGGKSLADEVGAGRPFFYLFEDKFFGTVSFIYFLLI